MYYDILLYKHLHSTGQLTNSHIIDSTTFGHYITSFLGPVFIFFYCSPNRALLASVSNKILPIIFRTEQKHRNIRPVFQAVNIGIAVDQVMMAKEILQRVELTYVKRLQLIIRTIYFFQRGCAGQDELIDLIFFTLQHQ